MLTLWVFILISYAGGAVQVGPFETEATCDNVRLEMIGKPRHHNTDADPRFAPNRIGGELLGANGSKCFQIVYGPLAGKGRP